MDDSGDAMFMHRCDDASHVTDKVWEVMVDIVRAGKKTRNPKPEPGIPEPESEIPETRILFGNFG
jgi:hypothetical protein